jgi:tetratricopeptide (TPR) repeat protein
MKSNFFKLIFTLAFVLTAGIASAQQEYGPEWGENLTPEERKQNVLNYAFYTDAYNQQRYDDALTYLPQLIQNAPKGRQNLYVYAINIYNMKLQRTRDTAERNKYIDSLFILYDLRLEHFGNDPKNGREDILKRKADHYLMLRPGDIEGIKATYEEAITANAANPDPDFINRYFKKLTDEYIGMTIETDEYLETYDRLSGIMDGIPAGTADAAKTTFDALFVQSGAADCASIERIFGDRLAGDPENVDNLRKAFSQLNRLKCRSPFFFDIAGRYFRAEPNSTTAIVTAQAYEAIGDNAKALEFLRAAAESETDQIAKANLYAQISGAELNMQHAQNAAAAARQAIEYNPENGYAYLFLAQAYYIGSASCEGFDAQTASWLAYDMAQQAGRIMAGNPDDAKKAEGLMADYRRSFPPKEELFFRGLDAGASYNVRCGWITGTTTVREGK